MVGRSIVTRRPAPGALARRLTAAFYAWERRGRGWEVYPHPVEIEPPFSPFPGRRVHEATPDDGRRPSFLARLAGRESAATPPVSEPAPDIQPEPFTDPSPVAELQVRVPPGLKVTKEAAQGLLMSLPPISRPLAFEVVGLPDRVVMQVAAGQADRTGFEQQLRAHFPEAGLTEEPDFLGSRWREAPGPENLVVDFGLSHEFMLPLKRARGFEVDLLVALAGAIEDLLEGEIAVFQVLFQPVRHPWAQEILKAVVDEDGRAFFSDAPQTVRLAEEKVSRPLFAAVVRAAAKSHVPGRAMKSCRALGAALRQFAEARSNELIPLSNDKYPDSLHEEDLLARRSRRTGMLLSADELASLVHPPIGLAARMLEWNGYES